MKQVNLTWTKINDMAKTEKMTEVLYLFAKNGKVRYVGKASEFSGAKARYALGYRHLIKLLLESGVQLYVSHLSKNQWEQIDNIERSLILRFKETEKEAFLNRRHWRPKSQVDVVCDEPWKK